MGRCQQSHRVVAFDRAGRTAGEAARRLDGWKAIASYLGRDVRTAQRWERELAMPVRRMSHGRLPRVFADPSELDAWLHGAPGEAAGATRAPAAARTETQTPGWRESMKAAVRRLVRRMPSAFLQLVPARFRRR